MVFTGGATPDPAGFAISGLVAGTTGRAETTCGRPTVGRAGADAFLFPSATAAGRPVRSGVGFPSEGERNAEVGVAVFFGSCGLETSNVEPLFSMRSARAR